MTLFVNLSSTHDYSIDETVDAFVRLCDKYSNGCLKCLPQFFNSLKFWTNKAWVIMKYQMKYTTLIEPYKLGKISTDKFLDNLSEIFYFMKPLDKTTRNDLLLKAWNASIRISDKTDGRIQQLAEHAKKEPVVIVSNTNEADVKAILAMFREKYPELPFIKNVDISITNSREPVEILPNVFLCLSYRYGAFKEKTPVTTMSLLEYLAEKYNDLKTLVSQYVGDRKKAEELKFDKILRDDEFYVSNAIDSTLKKTA